MKSRFAVVNTQQVLREGVCGRFDVDGHRRDTHTHTRAVSIEDERTVLSLIKEEETCRLEKIVCVMAICRGS